MRPCAGGILTPPPPHQPPPPHPPPPPQPPPPHTHPPPPHPHPPFIQPFLLYYSVAQLQEKNIVAPLPKRRVITYPAVFFFFYPRFMIPQSQWKSTKLDASDIVL